MLTGAIIGFGEVARHGHWPAYAAASEVRIAAVVDSSFERRALAEQLAPSIRTFATVDELARSVAVDFIDICTPPSLHAAPMLAALDHRWHVLCEKPFLLDSGVVETARVRASEASVAVVPVHNWKYAPIIRQATAALRAGAVGALRRVELETRRVRLAPTADAERSNWRRDPAIAGGGILMDHGWHAVYLVLHWFGERATAVSSVIEHPQGGVEEEASVTLSFPSGDAVIGLTWNGSARSNVIRLVGERGDIVIGDDTLHVGGSVTGAVTFAPALSAGSHHPDWFSAMLPDVLASFRNPALARPVFEEAAECLSIIQRAYAGWHAAPGR